MKVEPDRNEGRAEFRASDITVIISTHSSGVLEECVKSVYRQHPKKIIVILDDPDEKTEKIGESLKKVATIVKTRKSIFISRTRNLGIKLSKTQLIAFLDGDCVPTKGWIKQILKAFRFGDLVYGKRLSYLKKENWKEIRYKVRSGKYAEKRLRVFTKDNMQDMYLISGQNMACKRCIVDNFKFSENRDWQKGGEDVDFQFWCIQRGYKCVFNPRMTVVHHHPQSLLKHFKEAIDYGFADGFLFGRHPEVKQNKWFNNYVPNLFHSIYSLNFNIFLADFFDYTGTKIGRALFKFYKIRKYIRGKLRI
ncbi:MAG: glycosyltransferase [Caldisphaera sp.]